MTRWYRAYEGTVTDPKLAEAALVAGCSRSVAVAAWHLTLENAAAVNDGGRIDIPTRRIAAALCEPFADIETLFGAFEAIGLVADSHVAAWRRRQYESDNSTGRSQKSRRNKKQRQCNADATLQQQDATPPETETETEYSDANASGAAAPKISATEITKAIFDTGVSILTAAGRSDRQARSIIGRWRKEYTDTVLLAVLPRLPSNTSEPLEWLTKALQAELAHSTGNWNGHSHANPSLRGSRPDPALDMLIQAERELQAEAEREGQVIDLTARLALPAHQSG